MTDAAAQDPRPLHARIAADLRDEILNGDLPAGANLPSTAQLTDRFGASNATVQKALRLLKDERLVVGRPGASVSVRPNRQRTFRPAAFMAPAGPGEPYRWIAEAARLGARPESRLLSVDTKVPPADVAAALEIDPGTSTVVRCQMLSIDGEPVELVRSFYPSDVALATALAEPRRIKGGTPRLLADLGFPPRLSMDRVSARVPTQEEYTALRLPTDLPVLRTLRVVYTDNRKPIEVTVMAKAGHLYEVQYEFTAD